MKELIAKIGGFFALIGIVSSILHLVDYELSILIWIDSWGGTIGWIIRIGLIVGGLALYFLGGGIKMLNKDGTAK